MKIKSVIITLFLSVFATQSYAHGFIVTYEVLYGSTLKIFINSSN